MTTVRPDRSGLGLDLLNFLVAGAQTGFGAFISVHLAAAGWTQASIGEALSVGTAAGILGQVPGGLLVDRVGGKHLVLAAGGAAVALSAFLFAASTAPVAVLVAEVLHGVASCLVAPALAAISLAVAGRAGFGMRLGRNARYASAGSAAAALALGGIGAVGPGWTVFAASGAMMTAGLLAIPLLPRRAPAATVEPGSSARSGWAVLADPGLLGFAACIALFQFANAAMLPLVAGELTRVAGMGANAVIAACIVVPQALVAVLSPSVGAMADRAGRRPLLLAGFAALALRGVLLALGASHPVFVVVVQALDGISAAVLGVLLPLIAADLAGGRAGFTTRMAVLGLAGGAGATLSTAVAGSIAQVAGLPAALFVLAGAGACATLGVALLRETRPRVQALAA